MHARTLLSDLVDQSLQISQGAGQSVNRGDQQLIVFTQEADAVFESCPIISRCRARFYSAVETRRYETHGPRWVALSSRWFVATIVAVLLQSWAESSEDSVSHSLMAAACGRSQAVSNTRLTITASGFGCP